MEPLSCDAPRDQGGQSAAAGRCRRGGRGPRARTLGGGTTWRSGLPSQVDPSPSTGTPATSSAASAGVGDGTGPDIVVNGFVGWSVGENLMGGSMRVHGQRLAERRIECPGRHASSSKATLTAGRDLPKGATLAIAGDAGRCRGSWPSPALILIGGDAGHGLGDSLYEAVIYVAGSIASLGADAVVEEMTDDDVLAVKQLVEETGFDHIDPTGSPKWSRPGSSTTSPPTTTAPTDGRRSVSTAPTNHSFPPEVIARIHQMADTGQYPIRGLGARRQAADLRRPGVPHRFGVALPAGGLPRALRDAHGPRWPARRPTARTGDPDHHRRHELRRPVGHGQGGPRAGRHRGRHVDHHRRRRHDARGAQGLGAARLPGPPLPLRLRSGRPAPGRRGGDRGRPGGQAGRGRHAARAEGE